MRPIRAFFASGRGISEDAVNDFGLPALANLDSFNAASSISNYTQTKDTGSPVWQISGGECGAALAASTQTILRRNTFSQANAAVQVITHRAQDSGIVVRFQDQNNFYLLALSDDSGANPTANMRLFKRVGGTFTQLGSSVDIAWSRGTQKTFRLAVSGSSLTAYADGVSKIAVTDTGIGSAGSIGLRANSAAGDDAMETLTWG